MYDPDVCPRCGKELRCLGGHSAHPRNWYCRDEKNCGWQAWNGKTNKERAAADCAPKKTGIALIAEERKRQIENEGWTPQHDDGHNDGDMAIAGACYAIHAAYQKEVAQVMVNGMWPWHREWWKPKSKLRDLVRAGALIAAEIDKLQRHDNASTTQATKP